jgi:abhydrolase domain-containing protein 6
MLRRTAYILAAAVLLATSYFAAAQDAPPSAGAACAITTSTTKIGAGTIAYNTVGAGPDVLFIHGLFANKEQWNALACMVGDAGYRAIALDLPGYGASQGFALADCAIDREVELVRAFVVRLGIARVDIVGNSMGGTIAARYARRYASDVRTLAFLGAPLGVVGWNQGVRDAILHGTNPFIPVTDAQLDIELRLLFVTPPTLPAPERQKIVAEYVGHNRHYVQVWDVVNLFDDVLTRSTMARVPTLIVWGVDDGIYDIAGAGKLQRRIPGSELHELRHAGHLLPVENAADVAPIYFAFLKGAASTPTKP